jgi:lysophospholipase L1-like esterase
MARAHGRTASVVIVSAGTNDATDGPDPIGDYDVAMSKAGPSDLDKHLLFEALRWSFWTIRETWPDARCFAALPIQRADVPPEQHAPTHAAIRRMAETYGCRVIDATYGSGIDRACEVWGGEGRYLYDGLHPNVAGQKLLAELYAREVMR